MYTRNYALILGIAFLLLGLAGFVPPLVADVPPHPDVAVHAGYGLLFGLFPVNVLHNLVHIIFGIWGILAYSTFRASRIFARANAIIYGVLALMGLIPGLSSTFGLIPLFGHDIWLHASIAIVSAVFGWAPVSEQVYQERAGRI